MSDMSKIIEPKSDQKNSEDYLAGPVTYTIERVEVRPGAEQPVNVWFVGEDKPWRSCKSMSRCMVAAWGPDSAKYLGKSLTLYCDPKVKWGGMEVGGIRISHMSHIERDMSMALTVTKGKRAIHHMKVLQDAPQQSRQSATKPDQAAQWAGWYIGAIADTNTADDLRDLKIEHEESLTKLQNGREALHKAITDATNERAAALRGPADEHGAE